MTKEDNLKKAIEAVTKTLETQFSGITIVSSGSAPASGSDVDLYIVTPTGVTAVEVKRVASDIAEKYGDQFGVWVLPVVVPQVPPKSSYDIRVKSEQMRPTRDHPKGGWLPKAEVWEYSGASVTVTPLEPREIEVLPTKEAADVRAREVAQRWIRERASREKP